MEVAILEIFVRCIIGTFLGVGAWLGYMHYYYNYYGNNIFNRVHIESCRLRYI